MKQPAKFSLAVKSLSYVSSICDKSANVDADASMDFLCEVCPSPHPTFKCTRALQTHMRIKHGCRSEMRYCAPESGICMSCKTNYQSRLRLLAHLVDTRRPKCRDSILLSGRAKLSQAEVMRLDLIDRTVRTETRKSGHTHALAKLPATTSKGRIIGRTAS